MKCSQCNQADTKVIDGSPGVGAYNSSLSGLKFRTQEAKLAKGTFHRIQAGPMSKDSATSLCNEIKKKTPGGCLVVTK